MQPALPSRRAALAALKAAILLAAIAGGLIYACADRVLAGAKAYLFGYPLVIMDVTRENTVQATGVQNGLVRIREFPDARFKYVVRPNVDTLYTSAFVDMAAGPWVFEMPPNDQRYELMQFMDGWTDVFADPGTRTAGPAGGRYLLVGPDWKGESPTGMTLLRAPTRIVWLLGRTQTNGTADYETVHRIQDGLKLRRLADWYSGRAETQAPRKAAGTRPPPPAARMRDMDVEAFFTRLAMLMVENPPAAADAPMIATLARLGVEPGRAPRWGAIDRWCVSLGRWLADRKISIGVKEPRNLVRGWLTPPSNLGNYGTDYGTRAAVAMVGLGANLPADAIYPTTRVDAGGHALDGSHRYRLHFAPGELPPVRAFWSVTAYGADDFLIDNPTARYALGDRDRLAFNSDGSLDLLIQAEPPAADLRSNWLAVRVGEPFELTARLYWPGAKALDGRWSMPAVERVD